MLCGRSLLWCGLRLRGGSRRVLRSRSGLSLRRVLRRRGRSLWWRIGGLAGGRRRRVGGSLRLGRILRIDRGLLL